MNRLLRTTGMLLALSLGASLGTLGSGRAAAADDSTPPVAPPPAPAHAPSYSASDLYNTANAYARQGKPGLALLNYERARLLAPDDPDIEANLNFVRQSSGLPPPAPSPLDGLTQMIRRMNPDLLTGTGLAGFLLAGICLLAARRYPAQRWKLRAGVLVGLLTVGVTAANALVVWPTLHEGIVLAPATQARVSPVPMGDPLFVLQEAEPVRIAATHEGFVLVESRAGRMGWVAQSNIAAVVPR